MTRTRIGRCKNIPIVRKPNPKIPSRTIHLYIKCKFTTTNLTISNCPVCGDTLVWETKTVKDD